MYSVLAHSVRWDSLAGAQYIMACGFRQPVAGVVWAPLPWGPGDVRPDHDLAQWDDPPRV